MNDPTEPETAAYRRLKAAMATAAAEVHVHTMQGLKNVYQLCQASTGPTLPVTDVLQALGIDKNATVTDHRHTPRRGDDVETWLKNQHDQWMHTTGPWNLMDELLDRYRLHADTGTRLDETADDSNDGI